MEQDNKQPNNLDLAEVAVFKDNPALVFLYQKTERLVSALYMLSSLISDREPIKWQMREAGVDLLSQSLSLSDRSSSERILSYNKFISTVLKFLSLLEVSNAGGVISKMNYSVLKSEFENLIKMAESSGRWSEAKGLVFPDNFFEVAKPNQALSSGLSDRISRQTVNLSDRKMDSANLPKDRPLKAGASNRQGVILDLLRKNQELGIKDFVTKITDCSEKTIQRELAALVGKGVVKKAGEKRWSRYSLK